MAAGKDDEVLDAASAKGEDDAAVGALMTAASHIDDVDVLLVLMYVNRPLRNLLRDRDRMNGVWRKSLRTLTEKTTDVRAYHPNVEALHLLFWRAFCPQIAWMDVALHLYRQFVVLTLHPKGMGFMLYKSYTTEAAESPNGGVLLVIGPIATPKLVLELLLIYKGMQSQIGRSRRIRNGEYAYDHPYDCATMLYKVADTHNLPHQAPPHTLMAQEAQRYMFSPENWNIEGHKSFLEHGMRMLEVDRGYIR